MSEDWKSIRKIASLPGVERTAHVALAQTLEKANNGYVKSVYIGIEWSDGSFTGDWCQMPIAVLQLHARMAQHQADHVFFKGKPTDE
jgi:hypothetical protein